MKAREDHAPGHPANDLLVRAMDDELSPPETAHVEWHLSQCDECKGRYQQLRDTSDRVEVLAASIVPVVSATARENLASQLDSQTKVVALPAAGKVLRRFTWGMAMAATLVIGILLAPKRPHVMPGSTSQLSERSSIETVEVNGETFVALPYSNPDLPVSTSHVVQMQVPVSSLADAGFALERVSTQVTALDHSVLADVLVGMDGQPLGVHVLSMQ